MHSFIRSLIHRTSSGAPFTCPLHMPSAVRASGRSPEHGRKPPPRGGPALPFTSPENSFLSRQWGRVVTGSLRCKDAMRQRRRSGRGARAHPPTPRPVPPEPSLCSRARSLRNTCGLSGVGQLAPLHPSQWAGGRLPPPHPDSLLASQLPCLAQTVSVSSRTSTCSFGALPPAPVVPAPGPSAHWGQCLLKVTPDPILILPVHASRDASPISASPGPAWQALP